MASDATSGLIFHEETVVWLNEIDEYRCSDIQVKLQARIFPDRSQCIDFITESQDKKILLIISINDPEDILFVANDFNQVKSIYILNSKEKTNACLTTKYEKVRIIQEMGRRAKHFFITLFLCIF